MITLNREKVLQSFLTHKEELEKRNAQGIEAYRKGNFCLHFPDNGVKKITVKQKNHKLQAVPHV